MQCYGLQILAVPIWRFEYIRYCSGLYNRFLLVSYKKFIIKELIK